MFVLTSKMIQTSSVEWPPVHHRLNWIGNTSAGVRSAAGRSFANKFSQTSVAQIIPLLQPVAIYLQCLRWDDLWTETPKDKNVHPFALVTNRFSCRFLGSVPKHHDLWNDARLFVKLSKKSVFTPIFTISLQKSLHPSITLYSMQVSKRTSK